MRHSIKHIQSELGCTGNPGPNLEMCLNVAEDLNEKFEHVHETPTDSDAFIFLASCNAGESYTKEDIKLAFFGASVGCHVDIERCVTNLLLQDPELIGPFQAGVLNAIMNLK